MKTEFQVKGKSLTFAVSYIQIFVFYKKNLIIHIYK